MRRWRLSARIWFLVGLAWAVGTAAACFLMYRSAAISAEYNGLIDREFRLQDIARQMQVKFKIQVQDWKDILLRGADPEALRKYSEAFHADESAVRQAAELLTREAPDQEIRSAAEEFAGAHVEMSSRYGPALEAFSRAGGTNSAVVDAMVKGQDRGPTALVDRIVDLLRKRADGQRSALSRSVSDGNSMLLIVLPLAFGGIAAAAFLTVRGISRRLSNAMVRLRESAEQLASAAGQVSSSSQSLAQGSSAQAASLEETSASGEEISSVARQNAEKSHSAAELMAQSQQRFTEAGEALERMVAAMSEINAQSDRISRIIKVIDEIAFQTNILALNAAVEAARAGEAGMGFAVVADEVRNLAQRCAQAARDTAGLIEESISKSSDGKMKVDQVAAAVRAIAQESSRVKNLVEEVHLGSREQAAGMEQIATAIAQMEQITQKTAAGAQEGASASEELSSQAEALRGLVGDLAGVVEGAGAGGPGRR